MAKEKGDGYLKIGNKTIDNLIDNKKINNEMRAYFITVRMLNGWDNESLNIPVSTYANRLGIGLRYAKRIIKQLTEKKIIHRNGTITSIPGDYDQWWFSGKGLTPPGGGHNLPKGGSKVTTETVVKSDHPKHSNTPSKHSRHLATPLSRTEIDKLEGMEYFRAEMINDGGFKIKSIDDLIKKYKFMVLYNSWLEYVESNNVKNKPGFFLYLVEKYEEERKNEIKNS